MVTLALDDRHRSRHRLELGLSLFIGQAFLYNVMIVAGLVELFLGVKAERKGLEEIAAPLTAAEVDQAA
ncbi:hypothetical protein [Nonomuraea guangzhouensis]|uniref:Uncharacterized protein n=1 Tax=Nonomuraea guangzhouensis TaxID=1291555 RepID=A0ABW4GTP8_9ACTN|nr:hypothetical protein [Nonomuraea guangzhouensis]